MQEHNTALNEFCLELVEVKKQAIQPQWKRSVTRIWIKSPQLGNHLTRLMSGSLVLTTLGRSTNINNGRTIIITCIRKKIRNLSLYFIVYKTKTAHNSEIKISNVHTELAAVTSVLSWFWWQQAAIWLAVVEHDRVREANPSVLGFPGISFLIHAPHLSLYNLRLYLTQIACNGQLSCSFQMTMWTQEKTPLINTHSLEPAYSTRQPV